MTTPPRNLTMGELLKLAEDPTEELHPDDALDALIRQRRADNEIWSRLSPATVRALLNHIDKINTLAGEILIPASRNTSPLGRASHIVDEVMRIKALLNASPAPPHGK